MPAAHSTRSFRPLILILSALLLSLTSRLIATQPSSTFGDASPLVWSARLGNSEVTRLGTKMAYPAAKWDYANFLFLNSLLSLDTRLGQDRYLPWVKGTINSFLSADGRTIQHYKLAEYNIDHVAPAKAVFALYHRTKDARYRGTLDVMREHLKTHPRTKEGGFWHKNRYPHQMWLDGLFMGSPFYAEYGRTFNEPAIFDDVAQQIRLVAKHTYDEKTGLFYHAWDESREQSWADKTTGLSPNFWSRAIGWYAMALVDAYDYFPADHKARPEIAAIFKKLADGVIKYQDPATGVWWQVTDQGNRKGNYLEATASSMFVYSMAKAINQGILPRDAYLSAVLKGYDGIIREFIRTDSTGATKLTRCCKVAGLGYGRDGSFEYYISEPIVDNDAKGTGPFVLAGIELDRLLTINAPASAIPAPTPVSVNLFASTAPSSSAPSSSVAPATSPAASPLLHTFADDASRKAWTEEMPAILTRIKAPTFPKREFSIVAHGAPTDGKGDSTEAIRKAIEACHAAGGGTVLIPAGTFMTGAVHLKSNVNLHLDEGAKLLFLTDPKLYPVVFTRWEGVECMNYSPLIYAFEQENIAVTGKGTIDGQADYSNWWGWVKLDANTKPEVPLARASRNRLMAQANDNSRPEDRVYGPGEYLRPPLIQFYRCKNILIEDVTLLRSPFWVINPVLSQNITVRGVTINSHGANSDGCDPESCRDVLIENTKFDTGDDCIAIKSGRNDDGRRIGVPSENIIIRNCEFKDGHGGVVLGSECSGGIRNVFAENCVMDSPNLDRALRFKNNAVRGGILENVHMRNVQIGRVAESVLTIDLLYEEGAKGPHKAVVRNVSMNNITSTGSPRVMFIRSFEGAEIDDIRIANSTFSGITTTEVLQHIGTITLSNVNIIPAKAARAANSVPPPAPAPSSAK
jgi:unsaturated rhamnogalacturonyl hydrolase